jgi:hypothetical protein
VLAEQKARESAHLKKKIGLRHRDHNGVFWDRLMVELTTHLDGTFSETSMVVRCSTTEAVHLGVMGCVDTLSFLLMAGGDAAFRGGDSAVQDMARKSRIDLAKAQSHFDAKFRFTPRGAPRLSDVSVDCAAGSGADVRFSPLALGQFLMGSAYAKLQQIETET